MKSYEQVLRFVLFFTFSIQPSFAGKTVLDRCALRPSTHEITTGYQTTREMTPSGYELYNHCFPKDKKVSATVAEKPAYILLHFAGSRGRAEYGPASDLLARFPKKTRLEIWTLNYPGYGKSSGEPSLKEFPKAAEEAYDIIEKRAGTTPIIVSGQSMGTAVALYIATKRKVAGLILRNVLPLRELINNELFHLNRCCGYRWSFLVQRNTNCLSPAGRFPT